MLPDHAPFSPQQKQTVEGLVATLSPEQNAWLSAFLAGLSASSAAPAAAPATKAKVTVLYGTESGNAETLADQTAKRLKGNGHKVKVVNMADYAVEQLPKEEVLLTICSTWGDGDPPADAEPFFDAIMADAAPKMESVQFSVLGLGDTSYEKFCQCGKDLDSRFAALGASRISDRFDSDVEFEKPFADWFTAVETALGASANAAVVAAPVAAPPAIEYGKKHPFPSPVLERVNLNGAGSAKETIHVELGLEGSGLSYKPGDALGVVPTNAPELVEDFLGATGFKAEDSWNDKALGDALTTDFDIRTLSKTFAKKYAKAAGNGELDALLGDAAQLESYMWGREIPDLLRDYPAKSGLELPQAMDLLRGLTPRLYSIASSLKAHPDEVHLTVGVVRYQTGERQRGGICSTYLADRCGGDLTVPTYIHANKNFFLPEDTDTPIIMVGPGTGIAPFRAFIEERVAVGAGGKNWLFFGDQHFSTDFLYQLEWQDYFRSGALSKIDLAFSRDTAQKVYVQHKMKEQAKELYAWLESGAYFYVCGDASRMAKDVHNTLIEVVAEQGGKSPEDAQAYVKALQKEKRYQRDVY